MPLILPELGWTKTRCVPLIDDPLGTGEPCMAQIEAFVDPCELGAMCLYGTCTEYCTQNFPEPLSCPGTDMVCSDHYEPGLALCLPPCDPVDDPCPDDLECVESDDGFHCAVPSDDDPSPTGTD
ncbi:MAG: hypothetical protein AAF799_05715 [Myxococcota bacterium]